MSGPSPGIERFSIGWRIRVDEDYRHGRISEALWRDLIAAFEEHSTAAAQAGELAKWKIERNVLHDEVHKLRDELAKLRAQLREAQP